ncbi:SPOR domain-containing protein [Roseinatronobacter monicus]|uniref:SPOR domain-containing protein n=1 Tax=Roseinatronobacter monicus TaxID=393481 RepID=UPI003F66B775
MKESREFSAWGVRAHPHQTPHETGGHGFGPPVYGASAPQQHGYATAPYGQAPHSSGPYYAAPPEHAPHYATDPNLRGPAQPQFYAQSPQYGGHAQNAPRPRSIQTRSALHGFGAVLSLALMIGSVAWVWQLMQRDVAGVPVVRALEGPLRVAPDNPGGRQTAHQGLSVNDLSAAQDVTQRSEILLAPPSSDLSHDDVVPAQNAPDAPNLSFETDETQPIAVALQQALNEPEASSEPLGFVSETRRAVATSPRPPSRNADTISGARATASAASAVTNASYGSDDLAASVAQTVAAGMGSVRDIDVDPSSLGPGTRLVQLGAYDDADSARAAWDQLARRFSPLLEERGRVIEAAQSGGSVFYRLRAHGFNDERDARRFCAALVDQQIDCIPVLIR